MSAGELKKQYHGHSTQILFYFAALYTSLLRYIDYCHYSCTEYIEQHYSISLLFPPDGFYEARRHASKNAPLSISVREASSPRDRGSRISYIIARDTTASAPSAPSDYFGMIRLTTRRGVALSLPHIRERHGRRRRNKSCLIMLR